MHVCTKEGRKVVYTVQVHMYLICEVLTTRNMHAYTCTFMLSRGLPLWDQTIMFNAHHSRSRSKPWAQTPRHGRIHHTYDEITPTSFLNKKKTSLHNGIHQAESSPNARG